MRGTTCCERDASLAIIRRALRFKRIVANADVATSTYSYDADGNLIQAGGWNYMWDYLNRMLASGYNNSTTTYAYDPAGNRVLQTSTTSATYYPNKYSLTSTKSGANTYATSTNYIWNGDTLLATIDQPLYNGAATGTAIYRYIHPDHLGSTNAVTDQNGNLVQLMDYYPYGATRIATSTYPTNEKRQYIGQFSDAQTSLNYLNARFYDGQRGQFLSEDPAFLGIADPQYLLNPQMVNAYSYSADNPIVKKDPSGKLPVEAGIGALAGTIVAVGIQGVEDIHAHRLSSLGTYASDAAGGFTAGGIIGLTDGASLLAGVFVYGPTAGVAGGVVSNGVTETVKSAGGGYQFNYGNLLNNAPQNAVFGIIHGLDAIPGLGFTTSGGLSRQ
jgi:RHS repeat-associated protein